MRPRGEDRGPPPLPGRPGSLQGRLSTLSRRLSTAPRLPPTTQLRAVDATLRDAPVHIVRDDLVSPRFPGNKRRKLQRFLDVPAAAWPCLGPPPLPGLQGRLSTLSRRLSTAPRLPPTTQLRAVRATLRDVPVHIVRDDLVSPRFPGNKLRKLQRFLDVPAAAWPWRGGVVSWGGVQSNAMLACARLAAAKGVPCTYFVARGPQRLRLPATGNFRVATEQEGMRVLVGDAATAERFARSQGALFVPRGAAMPEAAYGVAQLAAALEPLLAAVPRPPLVVTPAGTGTTARYLRRSLPANVRVACVPVAGALPFSGGVEQLGDGRRMRFGAPHKRLWRAYEEVLAGSGVEVDLVFGARAWSVLLPLLPALSAECSVFYVHSGGLEGNESMVERYRGRWSL